VIHKISVFNATHGEAPLPLELMKPETSGFILLSADGLGPVKSNINLRENTVLSGGSFTSARTPSRNIVLSLQFLPSPTIEAARLRTYKYFPNETRVELEVITDRSYEKDPITGLLYGPFWISGYVEANTPSIFSQSCGTVISILCPDPNFRTANSYVEKTISSVAKLHSFPFEYDIAAQRFQNHATIPTHWVSLGETLFQSIEFNMPCSGTVNVGPTLRITAEGGAVRNPRMSFFSEDDATTMDWFKLDFTNYPDLADGDVLEIVCERQNKSVRRYRAAIPNDLGLNYIGAVTTDSVWPVLRPGNNIYSYEAGAIGGINTGGYIRFKYAYEAKFAGI
jgi:hypothetical protein